MMMQLDINSHYAAAVLLAIAVFVAVLAGVIDLTSPDVIDLTNDVSSSSGRDELENNVDLENGERIVSKDEEEEEEEEEEKENAVAQREALLRKRKEGDRIGRENRAHMIPMKEHPPKCSRPKRNKLNEQTNDNSNVDPARISLSPPAAPAAAAAEPAAAEDDIDEQAMQNTSLPAGTTEAGNPDITDDWEEVSFNEIDTGDKYVHPTFKVFVPKGEKAEESKKFCAELITKGCLMLLILNYVVQGVTLGWLAIHYILMTLFNTGELLVTYCSRGAGASGRSWQRTRAVLMRSKLFRTIIETFEEHLYIGRGSCIANKSGKHDKHGDKIARFCWWRVIFSFLCSTKIMWFENVKTGAKFGILVPHSALVVLSHTGSGYTGPVRHSITGGDESWIFTMDIGHKKK
jgi:hypothetical protein